jgi:hypothetical protein
LLTHEYFLEDEQEDAHQGAAILLAFFLLAQFPPQFFSSSIKQVDEKQRVTKSNRKANGGSRMLTLPPKQPLLKSKCRVWWFNSHTIQKHDKVARDEIHTVWIEGDAGVGGDDQKGYALREEIRWEGFTNRLHGDTLDLAVGLGICVEEILLHKLAVREVCF